MKAFVPQILLGKIGALAIFLSSEAVSHALLWNVYYFLSNDFDILLHMNKPSNRKKNPGNGNTQI